MPGPTANTPLSCNRTGATKKVTCTRYASVVAPDPLTRLKENHRYGPPLPVTMWYADRGHEPVNRTRAGVGASPGPARHPSPARPCKGTIHHRARHRVHCHARVSGVGRCRGVSRPVGSQLAGKTGSRSPVVPAAAAVDPWLSAGMPARPNPANEKARWRRQFPCRLCPQAPYRDTGAVRGLHSAPCSTPAVRWPPRYSRRIYPSGFSCPIQQRQSAHTGG
jgi:hypothetical protein